MVTGSRAANMHRGSGGDDYNKRSNGRSKFYSLGNENDGQERGGALEAAQYLYGLRQRLARIGETLDLNAARRGVDLGASYFDDDTYLT